jgi:hypothetical protein
MEKTMKNKAYIYSNEQEVYAYSELNEFINELAQEDRDVPTWFVMATEFDNQGNPKHFNADEMQELIDEAKGESTDDYAEHNTHWGL